MERGFWVARLASAACWVSIGLACGGTSKNSEHGTASGAGGGPPANGGTSSSGTTGVGGSQSGAGTGGTGTGGGVGATLDSLIGVICSTLRSCCATGGFDIAPLATCEAMYLEQSPLKPFLDDGSVIVNEAAIAPCIAVYQELGTTCGLDPAMLEAFANCTDLFVGTLEASETCSTGRQCRHPLGESSMCFKVSEEPGVIPETGTCQVVARTAQDSPCDYSFSCVSPLGCTGDHTLQAPMSSVALCHYSDGLFCNLEEHVCQAALAQDAPCGDNNTSAICALELACIGGSCQPRKLENEACEDDSDCAIGLACNGVCVPTPIVREGTCSGDYHSPSNLGS